MTKYCLTGTTGGLGSRVLHHLLYTLKISPSDLIISLYNPSKAPPEAKTHGITVRKGDFTSPSSLRSAFQGSDRLLLVSYPSIAYQTRVDAHINAINAARDVGISHIYYTSLAFGDESAAAVKQAHIATENYLAQMSSTANSSKFSYTIIKEGIYSESFPLYLNFHPSSTTPIPPEDRKAYLPLNPSRGVAWVTRDDLGEATARLLVVEEEDLISSSYRNQRVLLSGPQSWTFTHLANEISRLLGWTSSSHPLEIVPLGQDEWIKYQAETRVKAGVDPDEAKEFATQWATTYPAIEKGELEVVDPLCERLVGRKLVGMDQYLAEILGGENIKGSENIERYEKPKVDG